MNLAVDIGNSNIKFGLFENDELKKIFIKEELESVLSENKIAHAIISKTGSNTEIENKLKEKNIHTLFLSHELRIPIKILYKTPDTMGADRIAGSTAANFLFPQNNVLKIDFGTCITYDFVNNQNEYLGGAISPGMSMRFKALNNYTAKLPLVAPKNFSSYELIGSDTETSILSGVMNGIKEEVRGIINDYETRFGSLKTVATGGDADTFVTLLKCEIFARPYLVLEGMNQILKYNL